MRQQGRLVMLNLACLRRLLLSEVLTEIAEGRGIPRSLRSRPFRRAKGADYGSVA